MSPSIAFRRSPNPGALTALTLRTPRSLFTTSIVSASPSMSSAIITRARPVCPTFSRMGIRSRMLLIFFSWIRMYASSSWQSISAVRLMK